MKLIFITYINRSGSTFLANLLSKSPEVLVCPEAEVIMDELLVNPNNGFHFDLVTKNKWENIILTDEKLKFWDLKTEDLKELENVKSNFEAFHTILKVYLGKTKPAASTVVYKAERLIDLFQEIFESFGGIYNMYLVAIIRDCRAVFQSQRTTIHPYNNRSMNMNPVETVLLWNKFVKSYFRMNDKKNLYMLKYENLISDPENSISLLQFKLGLPKIETWSEQGDLYQRIPENQRSLHKNINTGPMVERITDWEDTIRKSDRFIIDLLGRNLIKRLEYQIFEKHSFNLGFYTLILYFWLQYVIAILLGKMIFHFKRIIR